MKPSAYVIHSSPGRCRIKIPEMRHQYAFFEELEEELAEIDGMEQFIANPVTASVLLIYREQELPSSELQNHLAGSDSFALTERSSMIFTPLWQEAANALAAFDQGLQKTTAGQFDVRSAFFIMLVLLAVRQLRQGAVLGPGVTLLWYALDLIRDKK